MFGFVLCFRFFAYFLLALIPLYPFYHRCWFWLSFTKINYRRTLDDSLMFMETISIQTLLTHLPLVPHICVNELVQVMACHLLSAKPLPELILAYCRLDSWKHNLVKFESDFYHFYSRTCNWNCSLQCQSRGRINNVYRPPGPKSNTATCSFIQTLDPATTIKSNVHHLIISPFVWYSISSIRLWCIEGL